jgi:hypothetical protein
LILARPPVNTGSVSGRRPELLHFLRELFLLVERLLVVRPGLDFFALTFGRGTLPPALRASESPIAIACFLLVTFLPERPLLSVPLLRSCIAFSTFSAAFFPYLAMGFLRFVNLRSLETRWDGGVPFLRTAPFGPTSLR